jgi:hypothetical protein
MTAATASGIGRRHGYGTQSAKEGRGPVRTARQGAGLVGAADPRLDRVGPVADPELADGLVVANVSGHLTDYLQAGRLAGDSQTDSQSGQLGWTVSEPPRTPRPAAIVPLGGPACPDTEEVSGLSCHSYQRASVHQLQDAKPLRPAQQSWTVADSSSPTWGAGRGPAADPNVTPTIMDGHCQPHSRCPTLVRTAHARSLP